MIYESGNRVLNQLERQIGKLALPKILRWIAGFQVLSWALNRYSKGFLDLLVFDRGEIMNGEIWRLASWVLLPNSDLVLFVFIAALFMFFINDSLESQWDSFRLNVYVIASILFISLGGLIPAPGGGGLLLNSIFYSAIFLAFASLFPHHIIHLLGIIPIKAKWLGFANAAFLGAMILTSPSPPLFAVIVLIGMTPYLVTFIPGIIASYRQQAEATVRRHKFESDISSGGAAFHECETCGATEKSHPEREFRVTAEGHEFCSECRKTGAA